MLVFSSRSSSGCNKKEGGLHPGLLNNWLLNRTEQRKPASTFRPLLQRCDWQWVTTSSWALPASSNGLRSAIVPHNPNWPAQKIGSRVGCTQQQQRWMGFCPDFRVEEARTLEWIHCPLSLYIYSIYSLSPWYSSYTMHNDELHSIVHCIAHCATISTATGFATK